MATVEGHLEVKGDYNVLNTVQNIQVLSFKDPEKLRETLATLPGFVNIITIYGMNGLHHAWIDTNLKLKKKSKA